MNALCTVKPRHGVQHTLELATPLTTHGHDATVFVPTH
ncbi:hypothetical protein B0G71_0872 [Paraburkholderia sp. BL27I4N3]|nr:hypothetical protein B0G71_0872 [Paraburkholderia sp. BL27I4N3]RKR44860.1 hypothetical protein B0G82_2486 [Paraburkholderia sp. BL17N1]